MLPGELYRTIREFIPVDARRRVAEEWISICEEFEQSISAELREDATDPDFEEVEDNAQPEGE